MNNNDFGREALAFIRREIEWHTEQEYSGRAYEKLCLIWNLVQSMQTQHAEAIAKAAEAGGEWVDCEDALPCDDFIRAVQLVDGTVTESGYNKVAGWMHVYMTPVRWFLADTKPANIPAPPPIQQPEPEIEVADLPKERFRDGEEYIVANALHKAAMRPVLKELEELRKRATK